MYVHLFTKLCLNIHKEKIQIINSNYNTFILVITYTLSSDTFVSTCKRILKGNENKTINYMFSSRVTFSGYKR